MNDEGFEQSIEDEYVAQQSMKIEELDNSTIVNLGKREENEQENMSLLLVDLSETLKILQEQMMTFHKAVNDLPEATRELTTITVNLKVLTEQMPMIVHEQCLNEYKKIINNAVKNYQQFRRSADQWQKSLEENHEKNFRWVMMSSIVTPVLVLLDMLFKH